MEANRSAEYPRSNELRKLVSIYNKIAVEKSLPGGKIDVIS
jgi:hypothetical protein